VFDALRRRQLNRYDQSPTLETSSEEGGKIGSRVRGRKFIRYDQSISDASIQQ